MPHFVKLKGDFIIITFGKTYLKDVSVQIAERGGRGKFLQKCLNYIMSQLRVKGGGVNLIETLSENMQFFFWTASLRGSTFK